jgi:hypothetical protein
MRREPHEISNPSVFLKCASAYADDGYGGNPHGDVIIASSDAVSGTTGTKSLDCPGKCALPENSSLTSSDADGTEYNRFCFYGCQPYDFTIGGFCVELDEHEVDDVASKDGNGKDPLLNPVIASNTPADAVHGLAAAEARSAKPTAPPVKTTTSIPCEVATPCMHGPMAELAGEVEAVAEGAQAENDAVRKLVKKHAR